MRCCLPLAWQINVDARARSKRRRRKASRGNQPVTGMVWALFERNLTGVYNIRAMNAVFFKNAPSDVVFVGGDPSVLREVQTVELGVWGDRGLADRLNNALSGREISVLGFAIEEKRLHFGNR